MQAEPERIDHVVPIAARLPAERGIDDDLQRIERLNPVINAYCTLTADAALAASILALLPVARRAYIVKPRQRRVA